MAGYLAKNVDEYIYIDIENQHPDSMRFIKDCERHLGNEVKILISPLRSVENAIRQAGFINRPKVGAYCTKFLKKRVRKEWEDAHKDYDITYVWGFDVDEKNRAERLNESMPEFEHEYPLIERGLSKQDAHAILDRLEREVGHSCINGVYLDELDPNRGRIEEEIMQDCGIMCYLTMNEMED